jgi:proline iminopeptidase
MPRLYAPIDPHERGMLDVGDGQRIYFEVCGSPRGKPAVALHGGPGSGCSGGVRRFFDPDRYRIVLFDQRGCGRSTPHASDLATELSTNTTEHLLDDLDRLRRHLRIDRWLLFGASWGSTLGLAYGERNPEHVSEIVLLGVTMTRRTEIDWLYRGVAPLFPEEWARFRAGVPERDREGGLVEAYHRLLHDSDPEVRERAAKQWHDWEAALLSVDPKAAPPPQWSEPRFRMARARIVTHYFRRGAWLEEGVLLREAGALRGIPGVMVHGRLDLSSPLVTAWELARAWPDAELVIVPGAGHAASDLGMSEAAVAATDRFAND